MSLMILLPLTAHCTSTLWDLMINIQISNIQNACVLSIYVTAEMNPGFIFHTEGQLYHHEYF